jgi:hypothetical protein
MPKKPLEAQTPAPDAKPAATREPSELQLLVSNLASELIMNGGRRADVENLIRGLAGHDFYLSFHNNEYADPENREISEGEVDHWFKRLSCEWPKKKREPSDLPLTTVSDQVRANVRGEIRDGIEWFMARGRMHELYLMREVLRGFEGTTRGADSDMAESVLASEFMYEVGRGGETYVKVPRRFIGLIEEYVALLQEGKDCGKAA